MIEKEKINVKIIWYDNAGENVAFQKEAKNEDLGLVFGYTAPDTPQQNGRVERKFQTLHGRVRAMLLNTLGKASCYSDVLTYYELSRVVLLVRVSLMGAWAIHHIPRVSTRSVLCP